ncbi:MAG: metal ABC transporter substrate-binding protein [Armatimonadota bacterium]|nr:metal ABC transporter substrate-binding protein [Armatimonadota bacterium]MCX7778145.1 metal ABC transporter substrate-binding protein [Armatimonadota bacterium]MDW8024499.1 metal ABC transporter substrate-binding protein [Armatimonadota bacterium]
MFSKVKMCAKPQLVLQIAIILLLPSVGHANAKKLFVVTTTPDLRYFAERIGGDKVTVTCLMHPRQNPHTVQPLPSFAVQMSHADLFVCVGLDFELWADQLLDMARNPKIRRGAQGYVDASIGIPLIEVPTGRVTREQGEIHIFGNPHYWLDPLNAKIIVNNIAAGLKRVSPGNSDYFEANRKKLIEEIEEILDETLKLAAPLKGEKIVAYHLTWSYLANRYGFKIIGQLEPKPGIPPSARHISELIELMKANEVKVILKEPFYENRFPRLIAQQTGAKLVEVAPSIGGDKGVNTYRDLLTNILGKLVEAITGCTTKRKGE